MDCTPYNIKAPALPLATPDYDQRQQDQFQYALRLYFNRLDNYLAELSACINMSGTITDPTYVAFGGATVDAFGRLRTSSPFTLFDSQNRYQADPQFSETTANGASITYDGNASTVLLSVDTTAGSKAVRQTYRVFPYQPGKSLEVFATFVMAAAQTNLRQRVGYFNTDNGLFFQVYGTTKSFVLRTNTSGTPSDARTVNQADWNGDKLDGTGASGITLDPTKAQILYMDFEWLGVGSVRCGFVIDGQIIICHTFNNANDLNKVYMTTAILPVRYEIESVSTTTSATMKQICSTVISEGGYEQKSALTWARRTAVLAATTTFKPLVSIQLKSTALGAVVLPSIFNALPIGSVLDYEIALIKNPTLTGASFTSNSTNVEYDVTATALTGGTITDLTYVSGSNQGSGTGTGSTEYNFDLQLGVSLGGTSDIYTLAARTISGSDDIIGSLSYYDLTD
jgi:hypothetical protein